jgi:uncharacterized iron-regulated protein
VSRPKTQSLPAPHTVWHRHPLAGCYRASFVTFLVLLLVVPSAIARAAIFPYDTKIVWQSPIGRDHPLSGRIWRVDSQGFVNEHELLDHLVRVPLVVAGESHINPDHHQLQMRILGAMFGNGRRISLGMEIFDSDDQATLDGLAGHAEPDLNALIARFGRTRRHRAIWEQYQPLIRFAIGSGLPLVAMDISRREATAVKRHGTDALSTDLIARFALDQPLPAIQQARLEQDLLLAHCGLLFSQNLSALTLTQRVRDATMANRLEAANQGYGTLLLAGYGHARGDRAVPYLLRARRQRGELVSILFASVKKELTEPIDYRTWFGSGRIPFDYVWFTPRVDDEDPCDRLRRIYGKDKR